MKALFFLLPATLLCSCADGKDMTFTGSTPAGKEVRQFLGLPSSDSIDFIRWTLTYNDYAYRLACNYGISKPNTNGFYDGGRTVTLEGKLERKKFSALTFWNNDRTIDAWEINRSLLHFSSEGNLLAGNGGWSYTLNNAAATADHSSLYQRRLSFPGDSVTYTGRTPCAVPGIDVSKNCYKIKWKIVFYTGADYRKGRFVLYGTNWRANHPEGHWEHIETDRWQGYVLYDKTGKALFRFIRYDDILLFADPDGKLLIGNHDFSFTLSRL